jgi:hypothetical protein
MGLESINVQLASLVIFILGLLLGFLLLRLRDIIFGGGLGPTYDHIDFDKKIEEEERLNLDQILKDRRCNKPIGIGSKKNY